MERITNRKYGYKQWRVMFLSATDLNLKIFKGDFK